MATKKKRNGWLLAEIKKLNAPCAINASVPTQSEIDVELFERYRFAFRNEGVR